MYYRDGERLFLSFFLALGLYGILFLVLKDTSWSSEPLYPDRKGPVVVTLEPLPEKNLPEHEQPTEPEPVPPPERAPEPESRKVPAEERAPTEVRGEQPPSGGGTETPPPAPRGEGGAKGPAESPASTGQGEAPPEDVTEEGAIEEEEPLDIRGESRVIYAEEPLRPEEEKPGQPPRERDEMSADEFDLDADRLDRVFSGSESPGEGTPGRGSTPAPDKPAEQGQPDHINIDFDTPGADRELLHWQDPVLSDEMVSRIPPRTEVVVGFTISPEGYLSGLEIVRSSGSTDVDAAIMKAMRLWRFEKADNPDIRVEARVRYVIQTR